MTLEQINAQTENVLADAFFNNDDDDCKCLDSDDCNFDIIEAKT